MKKPALSELSILPWYAWPLIPFVIGAGMVVLILLGVLAIFSIPYYAVYPEPPLRAYYMEATQRQRELLARRRGLYAELSFAGRVGRAIKRWRRKNSRRTRGCRQ
jgi:hypothetical protein